MSENEHPTSTLKRSLGLPVLTLYGIGTIVGAGVYALTGKVAGTAGMLTPLALLVSAMIAALSAFSFGELSARFPYSAGEAHYVGEAFRRPWMAALTGWMVIATGVVSAATLATALARFVDRFANVPDPVVIIASMMVLGAITIWGINESAIAALIITLIEVGGLFLVLFVAGSNLGDAPARAGELVPLSAGDWASIFVGAYLAFYAFVGFEDMVNLAEEVRQPERTLPWAILLAVGITGILYAVLALVLVLTTPIEALATAKSPLSLALKDWKFGADLVAVIAMLAGFNGALMQIVMASRVAYGLARKGQGPSIFGRVNRITQTPIEASAAVVAVVIVLAIAFPIETLAKVTSTVLLGVFLLVNLSLWRIKLRDPEPPPGAPRFPLWLPVAGTFACGVFLLSHAVYLISQSL